MFIDARELADGATLQADVAIVGAGAAGITIARTLAQGSHRVLLLESGGFDYEVEAQALYEGQNVGLPYFDLDVSRLRMFGGSTNHWAGRCRPMDPLDFEVRAWVPLSGWPIGFDDLTPYYREAQVLCQLGAFDYAGTSWVGPDQAVAPFAPERFVSRVWQFSPPTVFGEVYRAELDAAANVDVVLNANLVEIEASETGSAVARLRLATLDGKTLSVGARFHVLACGGLENPRLLLASNRQINVGLGNQHDMVGRCFMEHPHADPARAVVDPAVGEFYARGGGDGDMEVVGCLNLAPEVQAEEQLLNCDSLFTPDNIGYSGFAALRRIWNAAEDAELPEHLWADLSLALSEIDDTVAGLMGRFGLREYRPKTAGFRVWCTAEQAPNPDSRVRLGSAVDALGMPQIELDWRLGELDKRSLQMAYRLLGEEFGRTGLGRIKIDEWLTRDLTTWTPALVGGHHHMGTTRMSADPKLGVVDADSRVHGIANLYVAGSSVFTTSGSANPTLTIVALALRLAETLEHQLTA